MVLSDTAMSGLRGALSVTHTWNSCYCADDAYYCGRGWRTSMHQSVHSETLGNKTYRVWTDGDGTMHRFRVTGDDVVSDEDGLLLGLRETSAGITITDIKDNVMTFTKASGWSKHWLTKLSDALGSEITITYLAEGQIDRVTDPVGRYIQYSYTGNLLTSLTPNASGAPAGSYVSCGYTYTDGRLTGVTYSDLSPNYRTTYSYNGNLLVKAKNYDGVSVGLAYTGGDIENARRASATQRWNDAFKDIRKTFEYRQRSTQVTYIKDRTGNPGNGDLTVTYQFNDNGNVVSVRDSAGYAAYKGYDRDHANYPALASQLQRTNVNLLKNHSFETTTS